MNDVEQAIRRIIDAAIDRIPSLIMAFVILFAGLWFIKIFLNLLHKRFEKRNVDPSLRDFVSSIIKFLLYALLILTVVSKLGIQTTSLVAVLGAASLSIGLALQGSLSNFAGGVLILLFRPFRVGDFIKSAAGAEGTVEKIDILYSTLRTGDGLAIFSPNGPLANSVITNYSSIQARRAEYGINITYESNIQVAREAILKVLNEDERVLKTPKPEVLVGELTATTVNLIVRSWINKENFWAAYHGNFEKIKTAIDQSAVSIPHPPQQIIVSQAKEE
ncbi:small conductance mechanosensitive channel [bacterium A37T11]|nr:small conductance mechanosensitive channel [bacterium A37T11]